MFSLFFCEFFTSFYFRNIPYVLIEEKNILEQSTQISFHNNSKWCPVEESICQVQETVNQAIYRSAHS